MNENYAKAIAGAVLLAAWAGMLVARVPGADAFITFCQGSLVALMAHWATAYNATPTPQLPPGTTQTTIVPGAK